MCHIRFQQFFFQLDITPDKYLNHIINVKQIFKQVLRDLLDMTTLVKMCMIKFVLKVLDQEYYMAILKSIKRLLITCRSFDRFYLL